MPLKAVITTIQKPTPAVKKFYRRFLEIQGVQLIVIGDTKGPENFIIDGRNLLTEENGVIKFLSLEKQLQSNLQLVGKLPTGHYARKNIGYLVAISLGAECIYETDDDNAPMNGWVVRSEMIHSPRIVFPEKTVKGCWVNAYRYFTDQNIWPRGLPLDEINTEPPFIDIAGDASKVVKRAPIQQALVNNSPDVDAVWRLTQDRIFEFEDRDSVYLSPGSWCPFNSQSTWWWPDAYPLLYLPSNCSFRMTDIWRSFIAQRCLWELGTGVVFHGPEVFQQRNEHNLMKDFEDEVPGYLNNDRIADILETLSLTGTPSVDLRTCYRALVEKAILPAKELSLVDFWLADLEDING